MRNILADEPSAELHGIPLRATQFVADEDIVGKDVLDIGCGLGWFEVFALAKGARAVTGIEVSERDLETARRHLDAPDLRLLVASATELPFADAGFDTVVCWEVLEHIPPGSEPRAFEEIRRVLRPGGRLYLSTPHASWRARLLDPAWWLIRHRHYRAGDLRALAGAAGLEVESLEIRGGAWLVASILDLYVAKWIFRRRPFFAALVDRKVDTELARLGGWAGCFLKCRAG
ncbi:MAG TPA: class I SAM-dependent methyltransferase [Gaiellaceae bacterium]|nr:class I SAM-dependent methyltransferase [Gaiellaceae bacterium]